MDHEHLDNEESMFVAFVAANNGRYGGGFVVPTPATDMQALRARLREAGAPPSLQDDPVQDDAVQDGVASSARQIMSGCGRGS